MSDAGEITHTPLKDSTHLNTLPTMRELCRPGCLRSRMGAWMVMKSLESSDEITITTITTFCSRNTSLLLVAGHDNLNSSRSPGWYVGVEVLVVASWKCWLWPRGSVGCGLVEVLVVASWKCWLWPRGSVGCGLDCDVGFGDDGGGESRQCASTHS
ncbi:hypothetical protein Pmani_033419 [Petrolisthes manimaculis]|uniref:Uncharacterized protein n=1 Tax=Petrolisthes manimaculis TaxID=1843537 RepID=A0AAE1NPH1_9EUCA|nr:hypothetical protein Pmani_033419 [Petrolisthes manimaculis]